MGSNRPSLLPALAAVQLMLAVALAALTALHIYLTVVNSRQVRSYMECQSNQQNFNRLINESVAYATRTNPAILPALAAAGLRITLTSSNSLPASSTSTPVRPAPRARANASKP